MGLIDEIRQAQMLAGEQAVMHRLDELGLSNKKEDEPAQTVRNAGLKCESCRLSSLVVLADRLAVSARAFKDTLQRNHEEELFSALEAYAEARIQVKLEEES